MKTFTDKEIQELTKIFHRKAFPLKNIHTDLWATGDQVKAMREVIELALAAREF